MGQKVNPHGLRVGIINDWDSRWYAEADFADNLVEDQKIRKFLKNKLAAAAISDTEIERTSDKIKVIVHTAKPGFSASILPQLCTLSTMQPCSFA